MLLRSLRLRDFRNLREVELEPDPRFNVIVGPNGQGKTNLLEAIYFLAALKSFRALKNAALVRDGSEEASCSAWIDRNGVRREVDVTVTARGRKVRLNGNSVRKLSDFFGLVNAVSFTPEDVTVLKASPGDRRSFLDRMIFNASPAYALEVADYETALKQRNALIKDGVVTDRSLLEVYDDQLVEHAARIVGRRVAFVDELIDPFRETFAEIFGPGFEPDVRYRMKLAEDRPEHDELLRDPERLRAAMRDALKTRLPHDLARGHTGVGPHRDDLETALQGRPVREFASQGQHRAFVLALKITEIRLSFARLEHYPVLLLDDVSSELDPARNERLFEFLSSIDGQVFITTTDADYVRLSHPYTRWTVSEGAVRDG